MKLILALVLAAIVGCKPQSTADKTSTTTSATVLGSNSSGAPQTGVADAATGTVRGVVRIVGDESPLMPKANEIPVGQCFTGHKMHSKVFRKAADGGVADVLVAVTEYSAKVPLPKTPVEVRMEDCALSARTIVMTPGQEIHAKNVGVIAAIPHLRGAPQAALVVAVPGRGSNHTHPDQCRALSAGRCQSRIRDGGRLRPQLSDCWGHGRVG